MAADGGPTRYPDRSLKTLDPRFQSLILGNAAVERIATGMRFCEGPVWFGDGRYLLWSDIPNDRIMRWDEETGAVSVFRKPSNYANGNTRDRQGRLVTCEHDTQRLTRTEYDGTITVLADSFEGKRLTAPNDVVVKSDGSIWFSDNGAGTRGNYLGHTAPWELPFRVYRLDPETGAMTIAVGDMKRPNGLAFSPDEKLLYVVDTPGPGQRTIQVYDVVDNGTKAGQPARVLQRRAGRQRRHAGRHRRQSVVRMVGRRGRGRGRHLRPRRQDDRPHHAARALRQRLFRRPQAQPPVHGREPVGLFGVCGDPGGDRRLRANSPPQPGMNRRGGCLRAKFFDGARTCPFSAGSSSV